MKTPELTDEQHYALREYTTQNREVDGKLAVHPISLARVLAHDKPAAYVDTVTGVAPQDNSPADYLAEIIDRIDLPARQGDGSGWIVARTSWRLDLLPTTESRNNAYHKRCGVVYGYPQEAIEHFINFKEVNVTRCDLARAGVFPADEIAFTVFVPYAHRGSIEKYEEMIEKGKAIRRRITELSRAWDLPELDEHAEEVYQDVAKVYAGDGGTFKPATTFPPDADVSKNDIVPLLSD